MVYINIYAIALKPLGFEALEVWSNPEPQELFYKLLKMKFCNLNSKTKFTKFNFIIILKHVFIYTIINLAFHSCWINSIEFGLQIDIFYKNLKKKLIMLIVLW